MFGFASDIERADVLFTSLLVQMWQGLAGAGVALDRRGQTAAGQVARCPATWHLGPEELCRGFVDAGEVTGQRSRRGWGGRG
jgi:hypothetical protein